MKCQTDRWEKTDVILVVMVRKGARPGMRSDDGIGFNDSDVLWSITNCSWNRSVKVARKCDKIIILNILLTKHPASPVPLLRQCATARSMHINSVLTGSFFMTVSMLSHERYLFIYFIWYLSADLPCYSTLGVCVSQCFMSLIAGVCGPSSISACGWRRSSYSSCKGNIEVLSTFR